MFHPHFISTVRLWFAVDGGRRFVAARHNAGLATLGLYQAGAVSYPPSTVIRDGDKAPPSMRSGSDSGA
jgi:hypothetical protein